MSSPPMLSKTILLIEGESCVRNSVSGLLQDLGYRVLAAADGRAGLELFFSEQPDMVLTDLHIPLIDGLEVAEWLRQESPETPVVVILGTNDVQIVMGETFRSAWGYICNPVRHSDKLSDVIEHVFERAQHLNDNRCNTQNQNVSVKTPTVDA